MGHQRDYSDEVAARIDTEVRRLIEHAHGEAGEILRQHRATLDLLADTLMERETVDTPQLLEIFGDLPVWGEAGANGTATGEGVRAGDAGEPRAAEPAS
jgi:cell division protease FtsH